MVQSRHAYSGKCCVAGADACCNPATHPSKMTLWVRCVDSGVSATMSAIARLWHWTASVERIRPRQKNLAVHLACGFLQHSFL